MNNQEEVVRISAKHLGKIGGYSDQYDRDLLVRIPRYLNREAYGIKEGSETFFGVDVWNAYEVSAITEKGLPVVGMMKIVYSSASKYHVESKSIKLYLNSFNMTKLGNTAQECIEIIKDRVATDLTILLETKVEVEMFTTTPEREYEFEDYPRIQDLINLDEIEFTTYQSDEKQLTLELTGKKVLKVDIDFLRSNCRVTNQPDFGNILIYIKGDNIPSVESLARYVVSHRQVSHFHEEICEMVFIHLQKAFTPEELMVTCLYSRRGGLEINPMRASHKHTMPTFFADPECKLKKTLKQ